jgi:hypothetical protein
MYVHYLSHFMNVHDNIQFDACVLQLQVQLPFSPSEMNPLSNAARSCARARVCPRALVFVLFSSITLLITIQLWICIFVFDWFTTLIRFLLLVFNVTHSFSSQTCVERSARGRVPPIYKYLLLRPSI